MSNAPPHYYTTGPDDALESRTFYVGAMLHAGPEDVHATTQDDVHYDVHAGALLAHSENAFGGLLAPRPSSPQYSIAVPDESAVFNIVLHAVYDLDCAQYAPADTDVIAAVHALCTYGIAPARVVGPASALFALIVARLPTRTPAACLRFYALAGQYDLRDLAVRCSQFLLSLRVWDISNELATQMGVWHLKYLIFLHRGRMQELRTLLARSPQAHPPVPQCSPARQAALAEAWRLVGAYFIWNATVELTTVSLEVRFSQLDKDLTCDMCKTALRRCLDDVVSAWSRVKRVIDYDGQLIDSSPSP